MRFLKDHRGIEMLEAAITTPIAILVMLAIVNLGMVIYAQQAVQAAARHGARILAQELQGNLDAWDRTLPTERKKLLRRAVRSTFVRGDTFVALQPTEAFSPLVELKSGTCGEGGLCSKFDNLRIVFPSLTPTEILNFIE